MKPFLLISVVCLAAGVSILVAYCHGTPNMSVALPLSGTSLHIDITTNGTPALVGVSLTLLGAFLLIIAWFRALFSRSKKAKTEAAPPPRRDEPFKQ